MVKVQMLQKMGRGLLGNSFSGFESQQHSEIVFHGFAFDDPILQYGSVCQQNGVELFPHAHKPY